MFPKYYYPLKTTVRCFLLPSEQPGSLLRAIWCSLEILNTELLLPLFARWHAAKLKTGSTGSCDQLARVPLVLRRVLARVRDRTCERNSFQPVFMCDPFPPFFSHLVTLDYDSHLCVDPWLLIEHENLIFFALSDLLFHRARVRLELAMVGNGTSVSVN